MQCTIFEIQPDFVINKSSLIHLELRHKINFTLLAIQRNRQQTNIISLEL